MAPFVLLWPRRQSIYSQQESKSSLRCPCGGVGHIGKKLARLVGVGLILPLDGSSFVRHVGAFQGFISSLNLADLASNAWASEISQTRIFLRSIGYGLSQSDPAALQRRANFRSAAFSTSVHGRTSRRRQAAE